MSLYHLVSSRTAHPTVNVARGSRGRARHSAGNHQHSHPHQQQHGKSPREYYHHHRQQGYHSCTSSSGSSTGSHRHAAGEDRTNGKIMHRGGDASSKTDSKGQMEYYQKKQKEQLKHLQNTMTNEIAYHEKQISHHEEQIKLHEDSIERHKKDIAGIKQKRINVKVFQEKYFGKKSKRHKFEYK